MKVFLDVANDDLEAFAVAGVTALLRFDHAVDQAAQALVHPGCVRFRRVQFTRKRFKGSPHARINVEEALAQSGQRLAYYGSEGVAETEKVLHRTQVHDRPEQLAAFHGLFAGAVHLAREGQKRLPAVHPVGGSPDNEALAPAGENADLDTVGMRVVGQALLGAEESLMAEQFDAFYSQRLEMRSRVGIAQPVQCFVRNRIDAVVDRMVPAPRVYFNCEANFAARLQEDPAG